MSKRPLRCTGAVAAAMLVVAVCWLAEPSPASAQIPGNVKTEKTEEPKTVDPDLISPRETLRTFLRAFASGDTDAQIKCLQLPSTTPRPTAETHAFHLKRVIDRMVKVEYEPISKDKDYDGSVNFRWLAEQLRAGLSEKDLHDAERIVIARQSDGAWRFTAETVAALDDLHREWGKRDPLEGIIEAEQPLPEWLKDQFPAGLHQVHFLLADYQWISLASLIFIGLLADLVTRGALNYLTSAWFRYVKGDSNIPTGRKVWRPVGLLAQALVWYGGTTAIDLPDVALMILLVALKLFAVVSAIWTAFLLINLLAGYMAKKAESTATKFDDLLIPLVSRTLKTLSVCIGILMCAEAFNLPMTGLIGGLGLGGMALALASKDAVANLFGSVTVLVDRPFEVGDWIITEGVEGTVESVGFRSTRIRTFYNSQITVPNSLLTTATVDNMGRRRYRRIKTMLSLQYDTRPEQIDAFCEGIRELIRLHPYTRKDYYHVYFNAFSGSSLAIMLYCFVECPDWSVELREKHRLYVDIVRLAETLGVSFAFPTRTLHMHNESTRESPPEITDAETFGRQSAAQIAGPLLSPDERPGAVLFEGSTGLDDDA